jgi:hypothetical protein
MKRSKDLLSIISTYLSSKLPDALAVRGALSIQRFVQYPPIDLDERTCATYLGTGKRSREESYETVMVQLQLPKVLDPVLHHDAMLEILASFAEESVWADNVSYSYASYYPGEVSDGGSSSFVLYEIIINDISDDCGA